jgi:hypothetical protein
MPPGQRAQARPVASGEPHQRIVMPIALATHHLGALIALFAGTLVAVQYSSYLTGNKVLISFLQAN